MSLFPGDMFIGLGFGLGPESDEDMPEMSIEDGIILKLTDRVQELERRADISAKGIIDIGTAALGMNEHLRNHVERIEHLEALLLLHGELIQNRGERIEALENKVETLTRTLDIWEEMLGIEVVAVPTVPVFDVDTEKYARSFDCGYIPVEEGEDFE